MLTRQYRASEAIGARARSGSFDRGEHVPVEDAARGAPSKGWSDAGRTAPAQSNIEVRAQHLMLRRRDRLDIGPGRRLRAGSSDIMPL